MPTLAITIVLTNKILIFVNNSSECWDFISSFGFFFSFLNVSRCLTQDISTIKKFQHFEDVLKTKIHHQPTVLYLLNAPITS